MTDDAKRAEELWGPEIVGRRADESPEITQAWKHARDTNPWSRRAAGKNWDGKPRKERPEF